MRTDRRNIETTMQHINYERAAVGKYWQSFYMWGEGRNWFRFEDDEGNKSGWAWGPYMPGTTDPDGNAAINQTAARNFISIRARIRELDPDATFRTGQWTGYANVNKRIRMVDETSTNGGYINQSMYGLVKVEGNDFLDQATLDPPESLSGPDAFDSAVFTTRPRDHRAGFANARDGNVSGQKHTPYVGTTNAVYSLTPAGGVNKGWIALQSQYGLGVFTESSTTDDIIAGIETVTQGTVAYIIGGPLKTCQVIVGVKYASGITPTVSQSSYAFGIAKCSITANY